MNNQEFIAYCENLESGITYLTVNEIIRLYYIAKKDHNLQPSDESIGMFRMDFHKLLKRAKSQLKKSSKQLELFP